MRNLYYTITIDPSNLSIDDVFDTIVKSITAKGTVTGEKREQQVAFAKQVAASIKEHRNFMGQAGTGVGKTFAYLIPIILSGKSAVISTATKYLTDQLVNKDLAFLQTALADLIPDLSYSGLKGVNNYACLRGAHTTIEEYNSRASEILEDVKLDGEHYAEYMSQIENAHLKLDEGILGALYIVNQLEFAQRKSNFQYITEIPHNIDAATLAKITTQTSGCKEKCPYGKNSKCPMVNAFHQANKSKILVTNHSQIASWLSSKIEDNEADEAGEIFNESALGALGYQTDQTREIWVADEVHELESYVASSLSSELSPHILNNYMRVINDLVKRLPKSGSNDLNMFVGDFTNIINQIQDTITELNTALDSQLENAPSNESQGFGGHSTGANKYRTSKFSPEFEQVINVLPPNIETVINTLLGRLYQLDKSVKNSGNPDIAKIDAVSSIRINSRSISHVIKDILNDDPTLVRFFRSYEDKTAAGRRKSTKNHVAIHVAPLDVATDLAKMKGGMQFIGISATMMIGGSFDSIVGNLGVDRMQGDYATFDAGEVFDYPNQGSLYIPQASDVPDPSANRQGHLNDYLNKSLAMIKASNGGALCLLTTRYEATTCAKYLREHLQGHNIYSFDDATDLEALVEKFRHDENSVLVGTRSFFQGLDLPGTTLRLILINKIPFPVPDLLQKAREGYLQSNGEQGYNAFMKLSVAPAAAVLAQACGRLIRHSDDKGVVAIFDPRLLTKSYGRTIINSFPPFAPVTNYDVALERIGAICA